MNIVYGPVPSRRLGMSLGVDPIPRLTCTFDCIYCQLGKKRYIVSGPEEVKERFPTPEEIATAVEEALSKRTHVDYIAFSGSGEPTLNLRIGEAAVAIRGFTDIPIVLITNSSLLTRPEVFETAALFDLVLPSLDAGDQETFLKVNRPARGFEIEAIANAIGHLARRVPIWLEVMLVKSEKERMNTDPDSIGHLIEKIRLIRPHEVNLNTCVRPPEEEVDPVPEEKLNEIRERMEGELPEVPIIIVPKRTRSRSKLLHEKEIAREILRLLAVRPCTPADLSDSLGINPAEVGKYLARLAEEKGIDRRVQNGRMYYTAESSEGLRDLEI
jgi:wyosine [tRNA(Phe)-imidazoG37] synthetase (radical SAM superfamily)